MIEERKIETYKRDMGLRYDGNKIKLGNEQAHNGNCLTAIELSADPQIIDDIYGCSVSAVSPVPRPDIMFNIADPTADYEIQERREHDQHHQHARHHRYASLPRRQRRILRHEYVHRSTPYSCPIIQAKPFCSPRNPRPLQNSAIEATKRCIREERKSQNPIRRNRRRIPTAHAASNTSQLQTLLTGLEPRFLNLIISQPVITTQQRPVANRTERPFTSKRSCMQLEIRLSSPRSKVLEINKISFYSPLSHTDHQGKSPVLITAEMILTSSRAHCRYSSHLTNTSLMYVQR